MGKWLARLGGWIRDRILRRDIGKGQPPTPSPVYVGSVKQGDDIIRVTVAQEHAVLNVGSIDKVDLIEDALILARQHGATTGTLLTNLVTSAAIERALLRAAQPGRTWMGGRVTQLLNTPTGPQFRVDWDELPIITRG